MSAVKPKFDHTFCSQCGAEFGPGDNGFSHCSDHMRRGLSATTHDLPDNPFITEFGETYMRYDQLRVTQEVGRVAVDFLWRGENLYTMHANCDFSAGDILNLNFHEGRVNTGSR
jgi:hypothetical protein